MYTILAVTNPADQPSNGWGGPIAFLIVAVVVYALYKAMPAIQRWTGLGTTDDPSPTPPRPVGSRSNRQVTAGPRSGPNRSEPPGPPTPDRGPGTLRQAWEALRTGNPRPEFDDLDDDEIDETLDEFVARTYKAGDSDGDIIADAVEIYGVRADRVRESLAFVRQQVVRATLGIGPGPAPVRRTEVIDVPLDDAEDDEGEESFEEYVFRNRTGGTSYTHIVRDAAARYGKSESQVKRQITAVDRDRRPGQAA